MALNVQFGGFLKNVWKIFQDKGKNQQIKVTRYLEVAMWGDNY